MGEYRVEISDLAKQEIQKISSYIKYDLLEPTIAEKTTETIIETIFTLEDMPTRISLVRDERLAEKGIRGLQIKNYTAFFRINEKAKIVEIVRVLYSRRDWQTIL